MFRIFGGCAKNPELDKDLLSVERESDWSVFSKLRTDPGRVGLASVLKELAKLKRIDNIQLPDDLFAGISIKTLERYRSRISTESVQELQRHPESIRYTMLAAFCWQRRKAIIDDLVELMIQVIHRISVRAEKKVVTEVIGDLEKYTAKPICCIGLPKLPCSSRMAWSETFYFQWSVSKRWLPWSRNIIPKAPFTDAMCIPYCVAPTAIIIG